MVSPHPAGSIAPTPPQVCSYMYTYAIIILFMNTLAIKAIPLVDHEKKYEMVFSSSLINIMLEIISSTDDLNIY